MAIVYGGMGLAFNTEQSQYVSTSKNTGYFTNVDRTATNPLWQQWGQTVNPTAPSSSPAPTTINYVVDNSQQEAYYAMLKAQQEAKRMQEIEAVRQFFNTYNLSTLWAGAYDYLLQGYTDPNQISIMLSNNPTYQQAYFNRFPAVQQIRELNKTRIANGQPPIAEPSPSTYVGLEVGYREALRDLPVSMRLDTNENVAKWIVGDVSPTELADRVSVAKNYVNYQANEFVKQELRDVYGMTDSEMVLYALAPTETVDFLNREFQRRMAQATVGGAAESLGVNLTDAQRDLIANNEQYANSFGNSQAGFNQILEEQDPYTKLAQMSGQTLTTEELITDQFGLQGAAEVSNKKRRLASQERARFSGSSAIGANSLNSRTLGSQ